MNFKLLAALVVVVVIAIGADFVIPQPVKTIVQQLGSNGGTQSTQKVLAARQWDMSTGTTTSIQNNTGSDVFATNVQYSCTGVGSSQVGFTGAGLAAVTFKAATTSTSLTASTPTVNTLVSNTNLAANLTFSTSSPLLMVASSTLSAGGSVLGSWIKAGSYLTFFTNATNTAVCNVGVQVI